MILVGIDDTDTLESLGTNQIARAIVADLAARFRCLGIVRHQLLVDPRIPYTSKNSAAALLFDDIPDGGEGALFDAVCDGLTSRFVQGSDPGACLARMVPTAVTRFGRRCQRQVVAKQNALDVAARHGLRLEALGGTGDGVIGALAAVGLAATGDDGRVVGLDGWSDDLSGPQDVATLRARDVLVMRLDDGVPVDAGRVDVGKRLRPNLRGGRVTLFVTPAVADSGERLWVAAKLD